MQRQFFFRRLSSSNGTTHVGQAGRTQARRRTFVKRFFSFRVFHGVFQSLRSRTARGRRTGKTLPARFGRIQIMHTSAQASRSRSRRAPPPRENARTTANDRERPRTKKKRKREVDTKKNFKCHFQEKTAPGAGKRRIRSVAEIRRTFVKNPLQEPENADLNDSEHIKKCL